MSVEVVKIKRKWIRLVIILVLITIFICLGQNIKESREGLYFDEKIMKKIHQNISETMTDIMKSITFLGSYKFLILISFIIIFCMVKKKNWYGIIMLILSIVSSFGLNNLLKYYYTRTRPINYFLIKQGGYSFPSGHSMVSMTFYTTMTYLLTKDELNKNKRIILWILNFSIISLIGFSRIYLGVHWPTDIIGGYMAGILLSYVIIIGGNSLIKIK